MPRGEKPFYASKPSMKQSTTRSTRASSRLAKASQGEKSLSAVPTVPTLKDVVATVEGGPSSAPKESEEGLLLIAEGGAKDVVLVVVPRPAAVSNIAPVAASGPKEAENILLLKAVPTPLSIAVGQLNVESSSSSDDDSSDSGSEESESGSDSGSDSSSTTSSSGSHTEKPVKPSFPTEVGTVVVSTAELVADASASSVGIAKVLGPELPSASLFEGPPEEALPETYGPGEPEEADNEATDEGVKDVTNAIFEEANDDVDEEPDDFNGAEEETEKEVAHGGDEEEQGHEGGYGTEEEEKDDNGEEEEEQAVVVLEAEEEQPVCSTEVEDAAMVMKAFGFTSLAGVGKFLWFIVCILD
jgi:hypothetical protein